MIYLLSVLPPRDLPDPAKMFSVSYRAKILKVFSWYLQRRTWWGVLSNRSIPATFAILYPDPRICSTVCTAVIFHRLPETNKCRHLHGSRVAWMEKKKRVRWLDFLRIWCVSKRSSFSEARESRRYHRLATLPRILCREPDLSSWERRMPEAEYERRDEGCSNEGATILSQVDWRSRRWALPTNESFSLLYSSSNRGVYQ